MNIVFPHMQLLFDAELQKPLRFAIVKIRRKVCSQTAFFSKYNTTTSHSK